MNVNLPPEQKNWIEAEVKTGTFASVDDALSQAVAALMADDLTSQQKLLLVIVILLIYILGTLLFRQIYNFKEKDNTPYLSGHAVTINKTTYYVRVTNVSAIYSRPSDAEFALSYFVSYIFMYITLYIIFKLPMSLKIGRLEDTSQWYTPQDIGDHIIGIICFPRWLAHATFGY